LSFAIPNILLANIINRHIKYKIVILIIKTNQKDV